jgi:hypothetical protein
MGLDVGWATHRPTSAVCRLDWTATTVGWTIARFRALEAERLATIGSVAGGMRLQAVAVDGPLRAGFDVIGRYRVAERMLTRRLQPLIGKPGQSSAPVGKLLNAAANLCVHAILATCDVAISVHKPAIDAQAFVEAFPGAFLGLMLEEPATLGARRADRSDIFFQQNAASGVFDRLLTYLLPGRLASQAWAEVTDHDDRAALVCALTALCVACGDFTAVGDADGWIMLPPWLFIRPWAHAMLEANASEENPGCLYTTRSRP